MNLRKLTEADCSKIEELIEKDPLHRGKGSADNFYEPGTEVMAVEDGDGVFYVQISRALRVRALFDVDPAKKSKNAKMLIKFTPCLAEMARQSGFREMLFATESKPLAEFEKRLGFQESPNELVMPLAPLARADSEYNPKEPE